MRPLDFRANNFDVIRLLAAMQVAFLHGWEHLELGREGMQWPFQVMGMFPGVPVFFVVSGFLISASLERSPDIRSYMRNRFLRIYPGLWVCFLVSLLTVALFYKPHLSVRSFLPWVLAQLSVGQFYNPMFLRGYGVGVLNGSLWTIPVELQFYLLLPVLYFLHRKVNRRTLIVLVALAVMICTNVCYVLLRRGGGGTLVKLFGVTVAPYLYLFLIGVLLQRNRRLVARCLRDKPHYWLIVYVVSGIVLQRFGLTVTGNTINPMSAVLLALLVVSFAYSYSGRLAHVLKGNDISYGIYIYHMVIVNVMVSLGATRRISVFMVGYVVLILVAFLSWRYVERPALRLKAYSVKLRDGGDAGERADRVARPLSEFVVVSRDGADVGEHLRL